ncbi:hypothetical protein JNX00_10865 [Hydrogenophaga sp. YM1]|uniref:hypothetical protein n=1 Tax=Hydrogenophaga sp. YM1 TaxID=2806262 RepID=UPI001956D198|nr:hypothetical protein [Hydrogenophaga sp. YM1]QRR36322.1 hypothetical protein JNX00_10865 [Hydrogenophaga sp. YM1]
MTLSPHRALSPTADELSKLERLVHRFGCDLSQFTVQIYQCQATLGPTVEVVHVSGHGIHASYGRNHPKYWIQQLEDDLPMLDVKLDPEG